MRAKRDMHFRDGVTRYRLTVIRSGDLLPRSHPVVRDRPKDFEEAGSGRAGIGVTAA
ncbi:MAG: hypothetical protein ACRDMH_18225 [Solirubrobacterales bacterium]